MKYKFSDTLTKMITTTAMITVIALSIIGASFIFIYSLKFEKERLNEFSNLMTSNFSLKIDEKFSQYIKSSLSAKQGVGAVKDYKIIDSEKKLLELINNNVNSIYYKIDSSKPFIINLYTIYNNSIFLLNIDEKKLVEDIADEIMGNFNFLFITKNGEYLYGDKVIYSDLNTSGVAVSDSIDRQGYGYITYSVIPKTNIMMVLYKKNILFELLGKYYFLILGALFVTYFIAFILSRFYKLRINKNIEIVEQKILELKNPDVIRENAVDDIEIDIKEIQQIYDITKNNLFEVYATSGKTLTGHKELQSLYELSVQHNTMLLSTISSIEQQILNENSNKNFEKIIMNLEELKKKDQFDKNIYDIVIKSLFSISHNMSEIRKKTNGFNEDIIKLIDFVGIVSEFDEDQSKKHYVRVSELSGLIGTAAGLGESETKTLIQASKLHDIGKLLVPKTMLMKNHWLTIEEYNIVKLHTRYGYDLFKNFNHEVFYNGAIISMYHHERFDGEGYPTGIKGESIPLYARIVSIAEIFDALVSDRPYRKKHNIEEAYNYIISQSGKAFDPQLVKAFSLVYENIKTLYPQ